MLRNMRHPVRMPAAIVAPQRYFTAPVATADKADSTSNRLCGFMSKPVHIVEAVPQNVRDGVKVPSSSRKVCSKVDISQTVVSVFWIDSLLM